MLPRPRFRFYGSRSNYPMIARDWLARRLTAGDDLAAAETAVARFVGADEAVAMPQARVGIFLALKALVQAGQKVVLSPYTIHDVINMVICAGGRPVFADIERETCNIDAAQIEALVDGDTGAVLVTHLHGLACDIERIRAFCERRGVPLLEDAAQAFGCKVAGRQVGTFGTAGIYSFGMAKNVNSLYGGMVVTNDRALACRLREDLGDCPYTDEKTLMQRAAFCMIGDTITARPIFWLGPYWLFRYGCLHDVKALNNQLRGESDPVRRDAIPAHYLRRLTPMQARMIARQLAAVDTQSEIRIEYARIYQAGLADLPQIIQPPLREDGSHIYQTYPIQVPDRQCLLKYLMNYLRDVTIQHLRNTADLDCYREFHRDCPNARATSEQVLLLPTYPSYGRANVERNIALIRRYFDA
jgi:perosamine synthetase